MKTSIHETPSARFENCPVCNNPEFKPFHKHVDEFKPPQNWRDFFYGPREMLGPIQQCTNCDFHFLEQTDSNANAFYKSADASDYFNLEKQRIQYFENVQKDAVQRYPALSSYNTIVDFGCAAGNWLETFEPRKSRIGIELNPDFDPVLTKKGLRRVSDYSEIESTDPVWISAFDFVEHMEDPLDFLNYLAARPQAKDNVYLFGVPDLGRIWAKLLGTKYYLYCPMHFNYFTKPSLKMICERAFPDHNVDVYNSPVMMTNLKGVLKWVAPKYADAKIGEANLPIGYRANIMALITPKG